MQILSIIREILPHVSALNQMYAFKDKTVGDQAKNQHAAVVAETMDNSKENIFAKDLDEARQHLQDLSSTSNHYCIVESDHPYRSASISSFRCGNQFRSFLNILLTFNIILVEWNSLRASNG